MMFSKVISCGHYLPQKCVTNPMLPLELETSDEWIQERTGIKQRYIANETETTAFMAAQACKEALLNGNLNPLDIDAIIVATTSPDHTLPATAAKVQALIGATKAFAFDIQAACSGFVYGLSVADSFIRSKMAKKVLLVGAEAMSRIVDWQDRTTCVLFGDGAGAFLLTATSDKDNSVLSTHLFTDGESYESLYTTHEQNKHNPRGFIKMQGSKVFKSAVQKIGQAVEEALKAHDFSVDDIDWFVPHQANLRIIQGVSTHFNLPVEKVVVTVDKHANTSAASIPLAIYEAVHDKRIQPGHLVLIEAMGGGLTWASGLIRWSF